MGKKLPARSLALMAALGLAVAASAATWWRNHSAATLAPTAAAGTTGPALPAAASAPAGNAVTVEADRAQGAAATDLFMAVDWSEAPPAPPPPPLPLQQAPVMPPLPFDYVGRTEVAGEQGAVLVHLRRGGELFSVKEGQQIDEHYKLEKIGTDTLEIGYLPMAASQTLQTGTR